MSYYEMTAHQLRDLLRKGEVSAVELLEEQYRRIEEVDGDVKSYTSLTKEAAEKKAAETDRALKEGREVSPLAGIPFGLKDNMCTKGIETTCSSAILKGFRPQYNATVVEKLAGEGAVLLGKMNMDEFAMGSSTENSAFFRTANPWNLNCVPGGSSGGSASCVAADTAVFSLGSDTGGSIRQPASFCGVVGMKPTYGAVSRYGLIAFASSLDQIGPFTKDVEDCALVLNAITGHDRMDSTSIDTEYPDYTSFLSEDIRGMKIGVPEEYMEGIAEGTMTRFREAVEKFREMGAVVETCSLPNTEYAMPVYYIIAPAECSSNLARFDGVRYGMRDEAAEDVISMFSSTRDKGFGEEVKRRIMLGSYALSAGYYDAYYLKALKVRNLIKQDFDNAFEKYDCILTPTVPDVSFEFDSIADPLTMYRQDICTIPANLAGLPAMSVPFGFDGGLPVGVQLIGKAFGEGTILKAAYALEKNGGAEKRKPNLAGGEK